ncbi:MAG: N-methyl-L-tryptophan oxidase [Bryobacterales bacterium]|nr:N-methyl-L-tryptophan oxidase [Bryobacterales bacterium]
MSKIYDVAVIGLGTMGSLTCLELARRGAKVAGLDRFAPPHSFGSHSGETRVFRTAYAEHPDYVPLAVRSGELWDRFGEEAGRPLLHRWGQINIGAPDDGLIRGILESSRLHGIPVESFDAARLKRHYPQIHPQPGEVGLLEPTAGWIDVDASIHFALEAARRAGAEIALCHPALGWTRAGAYRTIQTAEGEIVAERVIVTAGAWAGGLLPHLPLRVQRRVLVWVRPERSQEFAPGRIPVFTAAEKFFYGFPASASGEVKIAVHWFDGDELPHLEEVAAPSERDLVPVLEVAARYLPGLAGPLPGALARVSRAKTCLYTMTPDEHFVVGVHPDDPAVSFAAGFSGHGFKFAPAIAEALSDLALRGATALPIDFLSPRRFA